MPPRTPKVVAVERLYVCENCARLGTLLGDFDDDCRPGWTHGRLVHVESVSEAPLNVIRATEES